MKRELSTSSLGGKQIIRGCLQPQVGDDFTQLAADRFIERQNLAFVEQLLAGATP